MKFDFFYYSNPILNYTNLIFIKVEMFFTNFFMILICRIRGIKLGRGSAFHGRTKFFKSSTARIEIGNNCTFLSKHTSNLIGINRPCIFSTLSTEAILKIGDECGFSGTVIGCQNEIILEDNVKCGANTLITDTDWHQDDFRSGKPKPIFIGKNVWLGEGVRVLKGVSIGENSVIGAASIVTRDIPSNVIAAGNPCKVIKKI
jgi:acetyltransferase-like isoleucine patch superfamily enzyme